jgi:hypothetical protein
MLSIRRRTPVDSRKTPWRGSKRRQEYFSSVGSERRSTWIAFLFRVAPPALLFACPLAAQPISAPEPLIIAEIVARRELLTIAFEWLDATVACDFTAQSRFYPETMEAFYLWRDVPKAAVLAEKRLVFERARTIKIKIEPPQILVDDGARSARMYFRKTYMIKGRVNRQGEVLQELRWVKSDDQWKIVSERDLRVIRPAHAQK